MGSKPETGNLLPESRSQKNENNMEAPIKPLHKIQTYN